MYLQEILEVAIGLVLTWLVLSTATMQIQEWIASILRWRASDLEKTIRRMFSDEDLTRLFYDHPVIRSLSGQKSNGNSKPSYIPAGQFSTVLLSIIQSAGTESALLLQGLYGLSAQLRKIRSKNRQGQARNDLDRLFELARLSASTDEGKAIGNLILASLEKEINDFGGRYPEIEASVQAILEKAQKNKGQIDKAIKSFPDLEQKPRDLQATLTGILALSVTNPDLRLTLNSLFIGIEDLAAKGEDHLQLFRTNLESWFNDTMDRLSGWYKRKAQLTAFLIGFGIAILLNVDTIQISNQLWREPVLRGAINANTNLILQQYGETSAPSTTDLISMLQDQLQGLNLPIGWTFESVTPPSGGTCSFAARPGSVFGFAWNNECRRPYSAQETTNGWIWSLAKLLGFSITGLASSQGSSFWFDILVKIINVRSAGKRPA